MVSTKKDILNPADSLHHDPQKLYEKQVHQSTQSWPRNGGKSFHVLVSLHDLSRASRVNKEASLYCTHCHRNLSHFCWLLCSPPAPAVAGAAAAAAQRASTHAQQQEQTSKHCLPPPGSTWHILLDFKEESKELGGSHCYHPMIMFQPWMKIPLSQFFFFFCRFALTL